MHYYLAVLKKTFIIEGRASRAEWWYFSLVNILVNLLIQSTVPLFVKNGLLIMLVLRLLRVFNLLMFIPSITVTIRRLHDINKNPRSFLLLLIPLIGPIWFLVLMTKKGDSGSNTYGVNPQETNTDT